MTLVIQDNSIAINTPVGVRWTREKGDPKDFDLRFVLNGVDDGFAANVHAGKGKEEGVEFVTFKNLGYVFRFPNVFPQPIFFFIVPSF